MKLRFVRISIAGIALAAATSAHATITIGARDSIHLSGSFSQGWLYSTDNNFPTANRGGTWDFRETVFNASTTLGSRLRVGAQLFAQRFGELGGDKVILDWAVADYNFSPAFGVRAGRVKYPKGLYGEALDLDVVRAAVFLPAAVYSPVMRDFTASFDGGMIYGTLNVGAGSVDYKAFVGDIPMSPEKGVAEFYNNASFYSAAGVSRLGMDAVTGGQLVWNTPVSGLRFAYSYSSYRNLATDGPFIGAPTINLHSNIGRFSWNTASAEYTWRNWTFAAEAQRSEGDFAYSARPVLATVSSNVGWDGWYVSAARRFRDRFEVGAYYGDLVSRFTTTPRDNPRRYQRDHAVNFRYDVNEHVTFKLEVHRIHGTYQTFHTARIPNPPATRRDHNTVFAAKTTFSF